jgi:predicted RNA-binding protein with PIN domain
MCLYIRLQKVIYILDGYNLTHRIPRWRVQQSASLERGREALLAYCRRWIQQRGDVHLFFVVFDGDSSITPSQTSSGVGVRVVYSATGQSADDKLLEIVHEFGAAYRYVVVSDDRYVVRQARFLEADVKSAAEFAAVLDSGRDSESDADDGLDSATADAITESLMREWNV